MGNKKNNNFEVIISPKRNWFDINLGEYWRYRDLYKIYIHRDLVAAYKQTILGPLWYVIQPLFTMLIYMFIFGDLAGLPTDNVPQPLFYFSGIMLWNYFIASFNISAATLTSNTPIFSKVYFPRLIIPLAAITSNLVKLGIQFLMFILLYLWCIFQGISIAPNWVFLLSPFLVFLLAMHAFSWGLIISSISYKYQDLLQVITMLMQLFMYVTPVVYPLSATPENFKIYIQLNPLSAIFEFFRYGSLGSGNIEWWDLGYSIGVLLICFTASIFIFNRVEKTFMDTI